MTFHSPPSISVEAARRDLRPENKLSVRLRAAEGLGKAKGKERAPAIRALREALGDAQDDLRFASALALGELGAVEATGDLLTRLSDPSALARQGAAAALGQLAAVATADAAITTADDAVVAADAAITTADDAVVAADAAAVRAQVSAALRAAVDDESADVRFQLPAALAQVDPAGAVSALHRLLDDDDGEVRASAAAALGDVLEGEPPGTSPADEARAALAERLDDRQPAAALEAAIALSRLGEAQGSAALVAHLGDRDRALLAAERLFSQPPPAAREALARHAGRLRAEPAVRVYLAGALAKLDDARGRERLERALRGRNAIACGLAIELCGRLGGSWARAQLEALREHRRGARWREEIDEALAQLDR